MGDKRLGVLRVIVPVLRKRYHCTSLVSNHKEETHGYDLLKFKVPKEPLQKDYGYQCQCQYQYQYQPY